MARAPLVASSIGEPTDIELVDSVLRAAPGAFDLFYRRHKQLIYYCILKQAGPRYAEDLCSAFFERLINRDYRALSLWQRGTSLPLYLRKVVRNFVIDFQRRSQRVEAVGGEAELDLLAQPEEETITTKIILEEFRRLAIQAWATLEDRSALFEASDVRMRGAQSSVSASPRYRDVEIPTELLKQLIASAAKGEADTIRPQNLSFLESSTPNNGAPMRVVVDAALAAKVNSVPGRDRTIVRVYDLQDPQTADVRSTLGALPFTGRLYFLTLKP